MEILFILPVDSVIHSLLDLAKLPLQRKRISYRKIRDIDFSEFCGQLENTRLVRDAASFSLSELVYEYNTTLKSLLDRHAPLKTKTITLRPTALWYTEEIRSEKKTQSSRAALAFFKTRIGLF